MRRTDSPSDAGTSASYRSLANFYSADPRRIQSRELDVGLWWRDEADGPLHRAAWVDDTGELYLAHLGPAASGGGTVEVLATVADRERLEGMLLGWRARCGQPGSLTWLRTRARTVRRFARSDRPGSGSSAVTGNRGQHGRPIGSAA